MSLDNLLHRGHTTTYLLIVLTQKFEFFTVQYTIDLSIGYKFQLDLHAFLKKKVLTNGGRGTVKVNPKN